MRGSFAGDGVMRTDANGLAISTGSDAAALAFDAMIASYLRNRADLPARIAAVLQADPDFALAHCVQGTMVMLASKQALLPVAMAAHQAASCNVGDATWRERAHVAALGSWIAGDLDATLATWEAILRRHPHDVLALRLAHFTAFWLGRPQDMLASIERVLPDWTADMPHYAALLGCRCFANEECGNHLAAEPDGRRAIELDPGDLWAAHGVAHVLEMQGRRQEGIAWLTGLAPNWEGSNNLQHHLWWHCALYHLEQRDFAAVLALYDQRFRNLASALTQAAPDLYIDVQNAASMLFRLERQGVAVGDRWEELADQAETRIGDGQSPFTVPHWMMALAAAGRDGAAARMLDGLTALADRPGTLAPILRDYALPVAQAVRAHRAGQFGLAVERMRPALDSMWRLGGSHAQQDVLEQLFVDAALRAGSTSDVQIALERIAGRRHLPPERWVGWRDVARAASR
jgi:hypothetical protein